MPKTEKEQNCLVVQCYKERKMKNLVASLKIFLIGFFVFLFIEAVILIFRNAELGVPFMALVLIAIWVCYCAFSNKKDYKKRNKRK